MRTPAYLLIACIPLSLVAQEKNPTQNNDSGSPTGPNPIFRVQVVSRSIAAVSYRNHSGWTKVDFQGTSLAPKAHGTADVNSRLGNMEVKVDIRDLPSPTNFGNEFLTYVLWAVTPEGHANNLGEVVVDEGGNYKADLTTNLQAFGLIVTAEPYFAVSMPSDVVVMENVMRNDTKGKEEIINAKYELMPRGEYLYHTPESQVHAIDLTSKKSPHELFEAENAVQIARYARADQYAQDTFQDSVNLLNQAEDYQTRKQWRPSIMTAKEAVQKAEDARIVSLRRQQQIALDTERQQAADREAAAKAQAAQQTAAAQEAARQREQAEQQAKLETEQRQAAERARADADAARAEASAEAQKAQAAAAEADRLRQQAVADKNALREQLLQQFNAILQTRETTRGLVINMSDVLFDVGKYSLKEDAKLKLARLSGIIMSHPGLNLRVEGYTDSTGSDAFNQKLSEQRADTVRQFLLGQGLAPDVVSSVGYGPQYPVASNDTSSGRAMNRRVEMVVSGEVIGVKIGVTPDQAGQQPAVPNGPGMTPAPQSQMQR